MADIPPDAPAPRLCRIIKRPNFEGFGFNLHAGKNKQGQFIGKVDPGSPAEEAGLKSGDRIIEVNGVNIGNENHKQVVQRIKLVPNETELLVVDEEADDYYTSRGIVVKSTQANTIIPNQRSNERRVSSSDSESSEEPQSIRAPPTAVNGRGSNSSESSEDLSTAPAPRLCHVVKWNENDGFGFHLLADKSRQGQYIGKVDVGSAAEAAGLKLGDRIIEINGVNVTNQTHKEVVARIKAIPNETKMLVIDPQGEMYYKERNLAIKSTQPNVRYIKTPPKNTRPSTLPLSYSVTDSSSQPNNKPHTSLKDISSAPTPRLCHVIKWNINEGYGFHLMADKKKAGHYIGKVDLGTPAYATGLRVGDRIVEVNGVNVDGEQHKQLVVRIKAVPNETKLLVLDQEADAYYKERNITVHGKQSNVQYIKTPAAPRRHSSIHDESSNDEDDVTLRNKENGLRRSPVSHSSESTAQSTSPVPYTSPSSPTTPSRPLSMATLTAAAQTGLDFNMSAAELRARLASRKKHDPRRETMELRRKHEIIQTM